MVTILVIEDDPRIRETIVDTLEAEGFHVKSAGDGERGIALARECNPSLILSDINMPKIDGYSVLETLRHDPLTQTVPFIFLTGNIDRDNVRRGMELGADDYITKPFKPTELLSAVHTRLEKQETLTKKYETTIDLLRKNITYALPHEFRTPLSLILGFAEVLRMDYEELEPQQVFKMAESIVKAGRRLQRLIENYLAYAQIEILAADEQQRAALRNHIIPNPGDIIGAQAIEKAAVYKRSDDLQLEVVNVALRVSMDSLRKVTAELVDNAFKFSKPGASVQVAAFADGNYYHIYVTDYGIGMTADEVENIGAYMQFDRTLHEQQGVGLGFTIAKRVVELYDGQLHIESIPHQGTQAHVMLPL